MWVLVVGVLQHLVARRRAPTTTSRVVGVVLAAGSAVMLGGAVSSFRSQRTTVDPVHVDRVDQLVTTGPTSVSRNPMYVGMAGVLLAHAVWRRSLPAVLPVVGFVAVMDRTQVAAEEAALRQHFGPEYDAYCRRVPRWIGPA